MISLAFKSRTGNKILLILQHGDSLNKLSQHNIVKVKRAS